MSSIRLGAAGGGTVIGQKLTDSNEHPLFGNTLDGDVTVAGVSRNIHLQILGSTSRAAARLNPFDMGGLGVDSIDATNTVITTFLPGFLPPGNWFSAGDLLLIVNLMGSSSRFAQVGTWERVKVASVSNTNFTVTLTKPLRYKYGQTGGGSPSNTDLTGQDVFIFRIPEYNSVTVTASSSSIITGNPHRTAVDGQPWGGIIAFCCRTLNVQSPGSIVATGLGYGTFAGGGGGRSYSGDGTGGQNGTNGAVGTSTTNPGGGGGGGSGGGGGGGSYATSGFSGHAGGGGGGGGAAGGTPGAGTPGSAGSGATGGAAGTFPPGNGGGPGGNGGTGGATTPTYGANSADEGSFLFMGSAGGNSGSGGSGGTVQTSVPFGFGIPGAGGGGGGGGLGGNGGGIVLIWAENVTNLKVVANGIAGTNGTVGATGGSAINGGGPANVQGRGGGGGGAGGEGGGGGAGGLFIIQGLNITALDSSCSATGGVGGSNANGGPGGGSAGGGGSPPQPGGSGGAGATAASPAPAGAGGSGHMVVRSWTTTLAASPDAIGGYSPLAAAYKGTL